MSIEYTILLADTTFRCATPGCRGGQEDFLRVDGRLLCPACAAKVWEQERETRLEKLAAGPTDLLVLTVPVDGMEPRDARNLMLAARDALRDAVRRRSARDGVPLESLVMPEGMRLEAIPREQLHGILETLDANTCSLEQSQQGGLNTLTPEEVVAWEYDGRRDR